MSHLPFSSLYKKIKTMISPPSLSTLEICCASLPSALAAQSGGADRIELCANLAQGGVTPSAATIKLAKKYLSIPVFVLIRPRKADFCYSDIEFEVMLENIRIAKSLGADGIVSGVLLKNGNIDLKRTQLLIKTAAPLPFTFHRAFDMCQHPLVALEELINLGVQRILTSGLKATALEGKIMIQQIIQQAKGRIHIMAGGGIRPHNIQELLVIDGLNEFHTSAKNTVYSQMKFKGVTSMGSEDLSNEFCWEEVDIEVVKTLKKTISL